MTRARSDMDGTADIEDRIVARLTHCPDGLEPNGFADLGPAAAVTNALNSLVAKYRLRMLIGGTDGKQKICRLATEEWTSRFRMLTTEEKTIYYEVEATGRQGLWVRQLRDKYPYPQYVNKVMRKLQDVHLIKQISPWDAPHKKIYMLVELEPLKSSVGACWLQMGGGIDHDVLNVLQTALLKAVGRQGPCTAATAREDVVSQGILKMDLVEGEARTLLKMLQYEGQLECYTDPYKEEVFVLAPEQGLNLESRYTEVPCGVCPVATECTPDGVISPATCKYFNEYLDF